MGSKHSKDKASTASSSSSSFFRFKSKSKQLHKSNKKKLKVSKSFSQLPGAQYATPYSNSLPRQAPSPSASPPQDRVIEYKLYQSYSDIRQATTSDQAPSPQKSEVFQPDVSTNFKVYRKSVENDRFETLLRSQEKNKKQRECTSIQLPRKHDTPPHHFNTIAHNRRTFQDNSFRTSSNACLNRSSSSKRGASRISTASIGYDVTASDMPSVSTVKKKTKYFELSFVRRLSDLMDSLPLERLLKQVVVGVVQLPNGALADSQRQDCFFINIERYLLKRRQLESVMECLVSKRLLQQLNDTLNYTTHKNYKTDEGSVNENKRFVDEKNNFDKDKNANQRNGKIKEEVDVISNKTQDYTTSSISSDIDSTKLKAVLKQIINSYLLSISKELSRIYEYQLSLISDGLGLDMASRYAADCIGDFLHFSGSSVPIFHVDSAVHSVVWRSNKRSKLGRSTLSVLIGEKELKWKIEEIFYKPGLRLDGLLYSKKNELTSPKGPFWRFFCHYGSDCLLYGYRGAVIDRFPRPDLYRVHRNELCFDTEVDWVEEDFHRCYVPYRKVVGWGVVQMYKKVTETKIPVNTSFTFSTPKRDSHSKPHDAVEGMPTSESDQILSFNSFVSILLGDEAAKEDMEVVCRYLQNEQTIRAHFNHLRSNELNTNNNNNNNTDGENDDVVPQDDISEKTRNDDSFNVNELNYTGQQPSFVISEQKPFEPSLPNCDTNTPLMLCSEAEDSTSCPKISLNNASSDESKNSKKKDVKNLIKYSLTPVKSQKMVDPASFIPLKHLGSLELDDLYTQSESYSTEDLTENTSTASACFPCDGVSQKACQDNEPFSKHDRSSDQSLGGLGPRCATEALKEEVDVSKITQNTTKSSLASEV